MARILVTGPESAGTKMTAALLKRAGAEVVHHTPRYCIGGKFLDGEGFDFVVMVIRNGYTNKRSMVENHHAYDNNGREYDIDLAHEMIPEAIRSILDHLTTFENLYIVTYEALVHEPEALRSLCRELGLKETFSHDPIKDSNAKYYGGEFFRDARSLEERT